jgi:hypothetical protein
VASSALRFFSARAILFTTRRIAWNFAMNELVTKSDLDEALENQTNALTIRLGIMTAVVFALFALIGLLSR